ncbi:MAG: hypothetical protein R3F61_07645 [Myxococcota bacterium]
MGQYGLDDLRLAFSMHVVDQIVAADDKLTEAELRFLQDRFPNHILMDRGFTDADGVRTDAYHDAAVDALDRLPTELDSTEKLELLKVFFEATVADDTFELAEGSALLDAARLLDLSDEEIDAFLATRVEVGDTRVEHIDAADD